MEPQKMLADKTDEELFILYQKEKSHEIKQELTLRYMYLAKSIAIEMSKLYSHFMQVDDVVNEDLGSGLFPTHRAFTPGGQNLVPTLGVLSRSIPHLVQHDGEGVDIIGDQIIVDDLLIHRCSSGN